MTCCRPRGTAKRRDGPARAPWTSPIRYRCATTRWRRLGSMRLTEFNELVTGWFGAAYGSSVLADHVLTGLGGRTGGQALEDGGGPRGVWRGGFGGFGG